MEFDLNSPILFVIVAVIIAFVLAQSIFFLVRAIKQSKVLGIPSSVVRSTVIRATTFSIAPAISIFIGVVALSNKLGVALPWLRLSIIGSLTYETTAADRAAEGLGFVGGLKDISAVTAEEYVAISLVMAVGALLMLILVPILAKPIDKGMLKYRQKDKKWGEIFTTALFIGLISAFLGLVFVDVRTGLQGWIPVFVMLISAATMMLFGVLLKVTKMKWITDFALPISMIVGMICAVPIAGAIIG